MEYVTSAFNWLTAFFTSIDYTPLRHLVDLNDARNVAAILGVGIAIYAASKKWGNAAIYQAQIGFKVNRPACVTNLSIANLKDKPLIIYQILASFKDSKTFITLHKFEPPLVIEGLKATSFQPEDFSSLDVEKNPFEEFDVKMDIVLVTESTIVKCKPAQIPEGLIHKQMKGYAEIGKSTKRFNSKVFTEQAAYALVYRYKDEERTSFILRGGLIIDDWPFRFNAIPSESMRNMDSMEEALRELSAQVGINLHAQKLR